MSSKLCLMVAVAGFLGVLAVAQAQAETIVPIIGASGDGTNVLDEPDAVAVDGAGNVFVAGFACGGVFRIGPDGTITNIIGLSDGLGQAYGLAVDGGGNVYVTGFGSDIAFRITPGGTITQIIDVTGDGIAHLDAAAGIAVDGADNVYVAGLFSNNVFKITPGGTIAEIMDATGDGTNRLEFPDAVAVDGAGNVYVVGLRSGPEVSGVGNVFKITPGRTATEIINTTGDGVHGLNAPEGIAVDGSGNVYVAGLQSNNVFKITPAGTITQIIDSSGNGTSPLLFPEGVAVDASGNVYVTGGFSNNVFKIAPDGTITEVMDSSGDGTTELDFPDAVAVDGIGNVYVTGHGSDTVFKSTPAVGHRSSRTTYRGTPPVGKKHTLTIQRGRDGNGQFTLPTKLPTTAELTVQRDGGTLNDPLTAGTWSTLGNPAHPRSFRYQNPSAPVGGAVQTIRITKNVLKVVARDTGTLPVPDGTSGSITTVLTADDRTYCAEATAPHFKDVADRLIQSKNQGPPVACAAP